MYSFGRQGEDKKEKSKDEGQEMEKKRSSTLIKRQSIIGMPVIEGRTGKRLGMVRDVYTSGQNSRLEGFYVSNKGWGKKFIGIPFMDATIGYDMILTEGELPENSRFPEDSGGLKNLLNKEVLREDGKQLGQISDILLDPLTGKVEALELSESIFGDLVSGRRILPWQPFERPEDDMLVITMEQADSILPCDKGIKNIFFNKL